MLKRLKFVLLFSAAGWLVTSMTGFGAKDVHARNDLVGELAPPLEVEAWLTPVPEPGGRMVLVDFWATWCPPCRAAIPHLNELSRRFSDRLLVVGLSNETPDQVRALASPRIEYSVAVDTRARMSRAVGVTSIPHVILVDPEGVVRWQGFPFERGHELTPEVVEALLDEYVP